MKLKTLNDLEHDGGYMRCMIVESENLKAEAIKRAKYYKEKVEYWTGKHIEDKNYWEGKYDEVMEANNITSEDLK